MTGLPIPSPGVLVACIAIIRCSQAPRALVLAGALQALLDAITPIPDPIPESVHTDPTERHTA